MCWTFHDLFAGFFRTDHDPPPAAANASCRL